MGHEIDIHWFFLLVRINKTKCGELDWRKLCYPRNTRIDGIPKEKEGRIARMVDDCFILREKANERVR
jgi:hypothetical protein